jgi:6-phosphogluconolactonase
MTDLFVYIGAYAKAEETGLYVYRLDAGSGALACVQPVRGVDSPSFFAISQDQRFLYAVNEVGQFGGRPGGGVSALAMDPATGRLRLINQQSSVGGGPCHVSLERTGRYALVANYGGGSVALLPIAADGSLAPACDFVQHAGTSVDPQRQRGPHAHSINVDPGNAFAHVPDLGLDRVVRYRLDLEAGRLVGQCPSGVGLAPGCGPRHMVFHPEGRIAYVVTEMGNTVVACRYDADSGVLTEVQTVSTLPAGYAGTSFAADIHLSGDGRFLYVSNRGHDSIGVFAVDASSGRLELLATPACGGAYPRHFCLDPRGAFLLCANQNSDNVVVWRRDAVTGGLQPTGTQVRIARPVCVRAIAVPEAD